MAPAQACASAQQSCSLANHRHALPVLRSVWCKEAVCSPLSMRAAHLICKAPSLLRTRESDCKGLTFLLGPSFTRTSGAD